MHLTRVFGDLSRARLKALIDEGLLRLNGAVPRPALRLSGGEEVVLSLPAPPPEHVEGEDLPLVRLYEDAHLLVLDKQAGMVVHPGAGHRTGTLIHALLHHLPGIEAVGGSERCGLVHRLDKDTSGCLVVAKTPATFEALQEAFRDRMVEKRYLALVHGLPRPPVGDIQTLYARHPVHRQRYTGRVQEGKPAHTRYRLREAFESSSLLEVDLLTGRTHQIRVHLSEAGHPLLGDGLYGAGRKGKGRVPEAQAAVGRQALHAWQLSFAHPVGGQPLSFEAPLPADFEAGLSLLREDAQAHARDRASPRRR